MTKEELDKIQQLFNSDDEINHELGKQLFNGYIQLEHDKINAWNVLGSIGWNGPQPFIETFTMITSLDDIERLDTLKLRHHFNTHNHYKCFCLKVDKETYNELVKQLDQDNEKFANWILSLNLNYFKL